MIEIRQCTPADLPYLYEICWKTADNGESLEGSLKDKYIPGHYFAAPYLRYDPECCFTATENGIPKGYLLGTADTAGYTRWLNTEWLPALRSFCSCSEYEKLHPIERAINKYIREGTAEDPRLTEYPAHLHIDLLPQLRRRGVGIKLMNLFFDECTKKGTDRIHLGLSKSNTAALTFYRKIGMRIIYQTENAYWMGMRLNQK